MKKILNEKYKCPCCGYYTLPGAGAYDICPVCFWEDDPVGWVKISNTP